MSQKWIIAALSLQTGAAAAQETPDIFVIDNRKFEGTAQDRLVVFPNGDVDNFEIIGGTGLEGVFFSSMDFNREGELFGINYFVSVPSYFQFDVETGAATFLDTANNIQFDDMAFNPADDSFYAISDRVLYQIDYTRRGGFTAVNRGTMRGVSQAVGLGFDSEGTAYVQDIEQNAVLKGEIGGRFETLFETHVDINFGQGLTIDWSRGNTGYMITTENSAHSSLVTFTTDGEILAIDEIPFDDRPMYMAAEVLGADLAIMPVPAPGTLALLAIGASACARRRR